MNVKQGYLKCPADCCFKLCHRIIKCVVITSVEEDVRIPEASENHVQFRLGAINVALIGDTVVHPWTDCIINLIH